MVDASRYERIDATDGTGSFDAYCALPPDRRFNPSNGSECQLAFFGPLDGFVLRLKVGVICGIILSSPFWLYQLWAFVTPGLRRNERRWTGGGGAGAFELANDSPALVESLHLVAEAIDPEGVSAT